MTTQTNTFALPLPGKTVDALVPHPRIRQIAVVPDAARHSFLSTHFGSHSVLFDSIATKLARKMIEGYSCGQWEFAETNTGAAFVYPRLANPEANVMITPIFAVCSFELSTELAGLIITSDAIIRMILDPKKYRLTPHQQKRLIEHTQALAPAGREIAKCLGYSEAFTDIHG